MIGGSMDTFLTQVLGHLLCGFPTQTIDNACFQRAGFDEVKDEVHLLGSLITAFYGEAEVRTVEAGDELTGIMQVELFDDVMSGNFISSSCQCHDRRLGEFLAEDAQLGVFRTEVMSPLTDTVGFVDGKERDVDMTQQIVNLRQKFFWGDVKEFDASLQAPAADDKVGGRIVAAVESLGLNAIGLEGFHLVFHQTDEWGDYDGCAWHRESWYLITDALSTTCRHQDQCVVTLCDMSYDFFLVVAEGIVTKIVP